MVNEMFYVHIKEDSFEELPWLEDTYGASPDEPYPVVAAMNNMLLLMVGRNLVKMYPDHLYVVNE